MTKKYDFLTKTKIQSGLQCPKKLWFDVHQPIKHKDKVAFRIGNLFGDHVKKHYSKDNTKVLDLTGDYINEVKKTEQAIKSGNINVIFEGAFEYLNTLVRTDVLIRKKKWMGTFRSKGIYKIKI